MLFKDIPIRQKLMRIILLISGIILFVISVVFFIYEFNAYRRNTAQKLSILGKVIATNSTAALAFDDKEAAYEILLALKAEPHIIAAALYDKHGNIFVVYPDSLAGEHFPAAPGNNVFHFEGGFLQGFQKVNEGGRHMGTLFLKSDLEGMYQRFSLFGITILSVIVISLLLVYILSNIFQKVISKPILTLSSIAKEISEKHDYSVRAVKSGNDELGSLTDSFNEMIDEIQKLKRELEQKVKDRTEKLETANKELEAFSYSVSHDLRAPLRAINGYSNMLWDRYQHVFDKEGIRLFNRIGENAKNMGMLIDDLLEFSRLGRKEICKAPADMTELAEISLQEINTSIKHNATIKIGQLHPANVDSIMMKQVLINLLSNAIKYSSKTEKPEIAVKSVISGNEIIYSISDNGVGFNTQYIDKLFGVFQRLHLQSEFEGTGVGLALVKRIINKHGGKVWATGELNKGATFSFSLHA